MGELPRFARPEGEKLMRKYSYIVTTDGSGNASTVTDKLRGKLHAIRYVKTDYAAGVDFTITNTSTGESLWTQVDQNASAIKRPRAATHDGVGAALLYAAGGTAQSSFFELAGETVTIAIAQGGATKTGQFIFY